MSQCFSFFRLKEETNARKELEKDVDDLKKTIDETELNCKQTQKEIDLAKNELVCLDLEHKDVSGNEKGASLWN